MQTAFFATLFLFFTSLALGQDGLPAPVQDVSCETFVCLFQQNFPDISAWLVATFVFLGAVVRATAEFLTFVGKQLQHQKTSAIAEKLGSVVVWIAQVLGWFGVGTTSGAKERIKSKNAN